MQPNAIVEKIHQAIDCFAGKSSNQEIINYIKTADPDINGKTIQAYIIGLTVNHPSRVHYFNNKNVRIAVSGSGTDLFYRPSRGRLEIYDEKTHGIWEIVKGDTDQYYVQERRPPEQALFYTPGDIKWVKNVSNKDIGKAYMDVQERFVLHFPNQHKGNVLSPAIGDIIALFQKINDQIVFTHLVSPVDNETENTSEREDYQYGRRVVVIAIAKLDNLIEKRDTNWDSVKFGGVSNGNACKINAISGIKNIDALQMDLWERFTPFFTASMQTSIQLTENALAELEHGSIEVLEGGLTLISHLIRERSSVIVKEKKRKALASNQLHCEACTFSFITTYNIKYIECHHKVPISEGERITKEEDLALVCANCHRMLHAPINGKYLSVEELKLRLEKNKSK